MNTPALEQMIRITQTGTSFLGDGDDWDRLRAEFNRQNYFRIRNLLKHEILEELYSSIEKAGWTERKHKKIGVEIAVADPGIVALLNFLLNDQDLYRMLERITDCSPIRSFGGRIYRMVPNAGHYDSWHTDVGHHRLLALSLNLGKEMYEGGVLQIRDHGSHSIDVSNVGFGDAIVFRLSPHLAHRVTNVEGTVSKTAFAGWFQSEPDYWRSIAAKWNDHER